jgi:hypothetical protein
VIQASDPPPWRGGASEEKGQRNKRRRVQKGEGETLIEINRIDGWTKKQTKCTQADRKCVKGMCRVI